MSNPIKSDAIANHLLPSLKPILCGLHRFQYMHSLEDILGLSIARTLLLSLAYAWGVHRVHSVGWGAHKPYLYASYLLAASCFPYIM
jgi:hypothetical protein